MNCTPCNRAADENQPELHKKCKLKKACTCQHRPSDQGRGIYVDWTKCTPRKETE